MSCAVEAVVEASAGIQKSGDSYPPSVVLNQIRPRRIKQMEKKMSAWFLKGAAGECGLGMWSSGFLILLSSVAAWLPGSGHAGQVNRGNPQKGELLFQTNRARGMGEEWMRLYTPWSS